MSFNVGTGKSKSYISATKATSNSNSSFSLTEYERMMKWVSARAPFDIIKNIDGHKIKLSNSKAGRSWGNGTEKGDYIIDTSFNVLCGSYSGCGRAYGADEFLQTFSTYEKFIDYVNNVFTKHLKAPEFKWLQYEYTQLSMF